MPLTLSPDELVSFKIMCAFIKATKSVEHEIVTTFCKRKGISVDELVDTPMKGGTIREMLDTQIKAVNAIQGDDQIARLKRTGLVDISTDATYPRAI
jgi:hypothetical protein